ncbi:MAG TPA: hypothetical protein VFQ72_03755 [Candidatus Paceibacterota bacterium]|nr:hypothetical protein [Candidatus Paceibacterota bacterium]
MKKSIIVVVVLLILAAVMVSANWNSKKKDAPVVFLETMKKELKLSGEIVPRTGKHSTAYLGGRIGEKSYAIDTGQIFDLNYDYKVGSVSEIGPYLLRSLGNRYDTGADAAEAYVGDTLVCWDQGEQSGSGNFYVWCATVVKKTLQEETWK